MGEEYTKTLMKYNRACRIRRKLYIEQTRLEDEVVSLNAKIDGIQLCITRLNKDIEYLDKKKEELYKEVK